MPSVILRFDGQYRFLSNFFSTPILFEGATYPSVENAFQSAKTLDPAERSLFTQCTAAYAKKIGRAVALRSDWETVKDGILRELLVQKFAPGTEMARLLMCTGDAYLCEGNTWHDNHFGACLCDRCTYTAHQNVLGALLMEIRSQL